MSWGSPNATALVGLAPTTPAPRVLALEPSELLRLPVPAVLLLAAAVPLPAAAVLLVTLALPLLGEP